MNHLLHGVMRSLSETFDLPEPILEIGSFQVEGQEGIADLRPLFPGKRYIGLDSRAGPGVDCIGDVEDLPFEDASVGAVLAVCAFEHVKHFWRGFDEVHRVLRPDGAFIVACPFFFRVHHFPDDYWRYTPSAMQLLLDSYPSKILGWHGPRHRPAHVWALAFREGRPPIDPAQFVKYQNLLSQYAREPSSWNRWIRYAVARLFCGGGPFAPYLERNRVETILRNTTTATFPSASSTGIAATSCGPV